MTRPDVKRHDIQTTQNYFVEWITARTGKSYSGTWMQLRIGLTSGNCDLMLKSASLCTLEVMGQYQMKRPDDPFPQILQETKEEKDLGVVISNTLKASAHIAAAVNKANQLLGLIRRSFTYIDIPLMRQLYTSFVRPHLEFGNVIWNPYLKSEMDILEQVQHRASRMIPGLAKLDYEARLEKMNLPSLTFRRARGDAIET